MAEYLCLPTYSIYIIGVVNFILVVCTSYLIYLLCSNKPRFYKTFELNDTLDTIHNNIDNYRNSHQVNDKKPLINSSTCIYNVKNANTLSEQNEIEMKIGNKEGSKPLKPDLQMIKNNNLNVVALITPEEMKNLCEGVLKKNARPKINREFSEPKFEIPQNDIELNKQENISSKLNKNRKSASVSNLYDIVSHPKPVNEKILSQDDIGLRNGRKKSRICIRDTITQYVFPLSARKTYVNA